MWKGVGAGGGNGKRSVLGVLPANARNSKPMVGAGSPRMASFGKSAKTSFPHSVVSGRALKHQLCLGKCVCDDVMYMSVQEPMMSCHHAVTVIL